jgi:hypothetical protein
MTNYTLYKCIIKTVRYEDIMSYEWFVTQFCSGSLEENYKNIDINFHKSYKLEIDDIYTSTKKAQFTISLILDKQKYKINKTNRLSTYTLNRRSNFIIYEKFDNTYTTCDGNTIETVKKLKTSSESTNISVNQVLYLDDSLKSANMFEMYSAYSELAESYMKHSNGRINLYQSDKLHNLILSIFDKSTYRITPQPIKDYEIEFLEGASIGALYYKVPTTETTHKYDVVSMYPSIMASEYFYVPTMPGKLLTLTTETLIKYNKNNSIKIGIFKATITGETKLFRFNKNNFYTHHSIIDAFKLNLKIEMIEDGEPNYLNYSGCVIKSIDLFSSYIDLFYRMKQLKLTGSKLMLNLLWGLLCETNDKHTFTEEEAPANLKITKIKQIKDTCYVSGFIDDKYYKTNYARLKPFLISKGRSNMYNFAKDHEDNISQIITDSLTLNVELPKHMTGDQIGQLKIV